MSGSEVEVAVIGAGAAGLAAALERCAGGAEVAVLEAGDAPGGVMRSVRAQGFLFERGPNAFQAKPAALAFLRRHGLEAVLLAASPESRQRALLYGGRLVPVPLGPGAALATPLLSPLGKLRVLREPLVPRGDASGESVAEFVARRLGAEALERLVAPFLVGVYAGDETRLGAEAVFPSLVAFEREHGSILRGALAAAFARGRPRGLRGSWSTAEGLGGLADAMASRLGARLALRRRVDALAREGAGFRLELEQGALRARSVVLAVPAWRAAELVRPIAPELAGLLASIEYAPIVSLPLALGAQATREPTRGFGFLVPRSEKLELLGALFMSRLFPGRAPPGRELVQCMIGGARWPGAADAPDDVLLARASEALDRALGLRESPELLAVTRWPRAVVQPRPGHPQLAARLRELAARSGPLRLAGSYLAGVSVADTLASGTEAGTEPR